MEKITMEVSEEVEKEVKRVERRSCSPGLVERTANCAGLLGIGRLSAQHDVTKHVSLPMWCNMMETNFQICPR
jgi:hypothetical protein